MLELEIYNTDIYLFLMCMIFVVKMRFICSENAFYLFGKCVLFVLLMAFICSGNNKYLFVKCEKYLFRKQKNICLRNDGFLRFGNVEIHFRYEYLPKIKQRIIMGITFSVEYKSYYVLEQTRM